MVVFKLLKQSDEAALRNFFSEVREDEVDNLRDDVHDPATISSWIQTLDYGRVVPLTAWDELLQFIVAVSTLHLTRGAYRHIADVRIVVGQNHRKLGLGSALIKELIELGRGLGLYYLRAEILSESRLPIKAFRQMGFDYKGTFEDGFMTRKGETRDVVLMLKRLRAGDEDEMFYEF
jgi:L-amino acid N-acyltransferase YncA